jgi:glycosyltransferase involved in cell wall biosynthesis
MVTIYKSNRLNCAAMDMAKSVVINTLNEGEVLARALSSVKDLADEIIVVDMESDDDSVQIAKSHGAKFLPQKVNSCRARQKFAVSELGRFIF